MSDLLTALKTARENVRATGDARDTAEAAWVAASKALGDRRRTAPKEEVEEERRLSRATDAAHEAYRVALRALRAAEAEAEEAGVWYSTGLHNAL